MQIAHAWHILSKKINNQKQQLYHEETVTKQPAQAEVEKDTCDCYLSSVSFLQRFKAGPSVMMVGRKKKVANCRRDADCARIAHTTRILTQDALRTKRGRNDCYET